jgi:hypothetical protein
VEAGVLVWESDLSLLCSLDEDLCWKDGFCSANFASVVSVWKVGVSVENVSPKPRWAGNFFLSVI